MILAIIIAVLFALAYHFDPSYPEKLPDGNWVIWYNKYGRRETERDKIIIWKTKWK